jgi:pantoate--beta-alanine ligase
MELISSKKDLNEYLSINSQKDICLIPTMGNLHDGHLELIKKSPMGTLKVVTIYVNKLQFDNSNDYENYPRTLNLDIVKCKSHNVDVVFAPDETFMNQMSEYKDIKLPMFTNYLCGKTRNGHFLGVYKIVRNLFDIIKPKYACFGLKDFQQLLLIKFIVNKYFPDTQIIMTNTIRNEKKIALSSRLKNLDEKSLRKAENIFITLINIRKKIIDGYNIHQVRDEEIKKLESKNIEVEYLEHRMNSCLETVKSDISNSSVFIACIIDNVRLIDNIQI